MRYNSQDELSRRQFILDNARKLLGVSVAPMLGSGLATQAFAQDTSTRKPAQYVIYLNMNGGMSHMDTFDLKDSNKKVNGAASGIKGVKIANYMPKTAKVLKDCTVINSMTSTQGAHPQAQYLLHKSYTPLGTISHPSLGSWITRLAGRVNPEMPGYVAIDTPAGNTGGGWMGANMSAALVGKPEQGLKNVKRYHSVSKEDFETRLKIADKLNQKFHSEYATPEVKGYAGLFDEAVKIMNSDDLKAFKVSSEPQKVRDQYGKSNFGQGCLLARRLVEVGVRFVEVTLSGWDTHYDNFPAVEARSIVLDQAYSALINDLKSKGLFESTLVVLGTEFGRGGVQPQFNDGRSHHPGAFSTVLAGGGINKGMVYGKTSKNVLKVEDNPVTLYDFNATIAHAVGINSHQIMYSPSRRPFRVAGPEKANGNPIKELFT